MNRAVFLVLSVALCCAGTAEAKIRTKLEGIYKIDTFTENAAGCDAPGDSVLQQKKEKMVVVQKIVFRLGKRKKELLQLASCSDEKDCAAKIEKLKQAKPVRAETSLLFEKGNDRRGFVGQRISTGQDKGDHCENGRLIQFLLKKSGKQGISLTSKTVVVERFKKTKRGKRAYCTSKTVQKLGKKKLKKKSACGGQSALAATRI